MEEPRQRSSTQKMPRSLCLPLRVLISRAIPTAHFSWCTVWFSFVLIGVTQRLWRLPKDLRSHWNYRKHRIWDVRARRDATSTPNWALCLFVWMVMAACGDRVARRRWRRKERKWHDSVIWKIDTLCTLTKIPPKIFETTHGSMITVITVTIMWNRNLVNS